MTISFQSQMCRLRGNCSGRSHRLVMRRWDNLYVGFGSQRAARCDFGVREDDYIRDQVIDKCYLSHLRRKFLEQEGSVTLDLSLNLKGAGGR